MGAHTCPIRGLVSYRRSATLSKGGWRGAFLMVVRSVFRDPGLILDGEKSKSTISVMWCSRRDRYSRGVNRTVHS